MFFPDISPFVLEIFIINKFVLIPKIPLQRKIYIKTQAPNLNNFSQLNKILLKKSLTQD